MRLGTPEMAAHGLCLSLALLVGVLISSAPASGQDKPTLKDVLGKVQSESETKAVEDLVDKLKGTARKPDKRAPAPAAAPGSTARTRAAHGAAGSPCCQGDARRRAAEGGLSVDAHGTRSQARAEA